MEVGIFIPIVATAGVTPESVRLTTVIVGALSVVATFFCAGELQLFAQQIEQRGARIDCELVLFSIDSQLQRHRARFGRGLFDFNHSGAAAAYGKTHDRASREHAGAGNKLTPVHGPAIDRTLPLVFRIPAARFQILMVHHASSRRTYFATF